MKAVIIAVGDEVLEGDVINSNAAFLAQQLVEIGFEVLYHKTVGDYVEPVEQSFNEAYLKADLIITSGGLGPTKDDMTKKTITDAMGLELIFDELIKKEISDYFSKNGRIMSDNNLTQCYIPKGGKVLANNYGTAPGVYLETSEKIVIMLPGPPRELNPMFIEYARPLLVKKAKKNYFEKYYMTSGIGEAPIEAILRGAVTENEEYMINTYLTSSGVMIKATARAGSELEAKSIIDRNDDKLKQVLNGYLYAEEKKELWEIVCEMLLERGLTISSAESFTGGLFSETISRISGISAVFKGSVTSYTVEAKKNVLGVDEDTIRRFGTISEQTAVKMAKCASEIFGSDIAVSFTGVAGPEKSEDKPVGTSHIAIYFKGEIKTDTNLFISDRANIKLRSVNRAFYLLYEMLKASEI